TCSEVLPTLLLDAASGSEVAKAAAASTAILAVVILTTVSPSPNITVPENNRFRPVFDFLIGARGRRSLGFRRKFDFLVMRSRCRDEFLNFDGNRLGGRRIIHRLLESGNASFAGCTVGAVGMIDAD